MTDRLVRTTPHQELGHPSNKALEALRSYVTAELFSRSLEIAQENQENERTIKDTRDQHLLSLEKLTTAELHFYNEMKSILERNTDNCINKETTEELSRDGLSGAQIKELSRLYKVFHPEVSDSTG